MQIKELKAKELLLEIMQSADLVKFAKYTPTTEEVKEYKNNTLQFLKEHEPSLEETTNV